VYQFATILDTGYLARALVLYRSLVESCPDFRLRIFCMDEQSERLLDKLALPHVDTVSLAELEEHDPAFAAVRSERTHREYCWTAFPLVPLYLLEVEPGLDSVAYVDGDLMFFADPAPLFEGLGSSSVALTRHDWSHAYERQPDTGRSADETFGIYNTGFTIFRRGEGIRALRWWRERCLDSCPDDPSGVSGYGDQTYLDDWETRFEGVQVIRHRGAHLAPWNFAGRNVQAHGRTVIVDGQPLLFYHFASLRLLGGAAKVRRAGFGRQAYHVTRRPVPLVWTTPWHAWGMTKLEHELLWEPYVQRVSDAMALIREVDPGYTPVLEQAGTGEVVRSIVSPMVPRRLRRAFRSGLALSVRAGQPRTQ